MEWEVVLSANHVHGDVGELAGSENWISALPTLLGEFTELLRDTLDLMREFGVAEDRSDLSYVSQPSIGEHAQNSSLRDWTVLIELNCDAWRAAAAVSPDRALLAAKAWSQAPYPLFRRLAFFAAAQPDIVPRSQGLGWLLADEEWWLWSVETQRETMRLLVALLALDYGAEEEDDDIVGRAINHPVGHVTEGLLQWWYRSDLEVEGGLADEPRRVFTRLCDTGVLDLGMSDELSDHRKALPELYRARSDGVGRESVLLGSGVSGIEEPDPLVTVPLGRADPNERRRSLRAMRANPSSGRTNAAARRSGA